jgi:1,2-diacylglycerol 3-alpha-glucosyltransferase
MRLVHVTGYYAVGMAYQENLLPLGQVELGHDVTVITGRLEPDFGFNKINRKKRKGLHIDKGVKVYRLNHYFELRNKGPALIGLFYHLFRLKPDVLFVHGIGTSFLVCLIYKLIRPNIRLQFDCHSTFQNSLKSKYGPIYHNVFRWFFRKFKLKFDKLFCVSPESIDFMAEVYDIPRDCLSLLPLPGDASLIISANEIRLDVRKQLGFSSDELLLIHTGKLPGDKETDRLLRAFSSIKDNNVRLLIAGDIDKAYKQRFDSFLVSDPRIIYLGWVSAERLRELFIASDLLVQPGSLSNSFIDAICCSLPVLLDDTAQGRYLTSSGNGVLLNRGSDTILASRLESLLEPAVLSVLKLNAKNISMSFHYLTIAKMTIDHLEISNLE